ncbi:MAG: thioredoxin family protein, partial [Gammaproteobacteria bacterium]|nr:thioredoxin family protein [Gammaproteobacteria bacterium]
MTAEPESSQAMDFKDIEDPAQHITLERKAALAEDKLLLWVLGGDWCHDSRSLASKLATPELQAIIDKHYRLSTISVGYLNAGFEFTDIANMLTFYATPTVLIIDPESMQLLNAQDMHIWANA